MPEFIQITTTTADQAAAQEIARVLIERRLAACVQVAGPITSTYRWQGQIETSQEWAVTAKTRRDLYEALGLDRDREATPEEVRTGEARLFDYVLARVQLRQRCNSCRGHKQS